MNVRRRQTEGGVSGFSSVGKECTGVVNKMKKQDNKPHDIQGAIGMSKIKTEGYHVLKGSVLKG